MENLQVSKIYFIASLLTLILRTWNILTSTIFSENFFNASSKIQGKLKIKFVLHKAHFFEKLIFHQLLALDILCPSLPTKTTFGISWGFIGDYIEEVNVNRRLFRSNFCCLPRVHPCLPTLRFLRKWFLHSLFYFRQTWAKHETKVGKRKVPKVACTRNQLKDRL